MTKRSQPETSKAAYQSLDPVQMAEIYRLILWALGQIEEGTMEDLAKTCKLPKERIWKRLSELRIKRLIYRPGNTKVLSSGRKGYTWRLVPPESGGTAPEKVTEKSLPGTSVADYSRKILQPTLF